MYGIKNHQPLGKRQICGDPHTHSIVLYGGGCLHAHHGVPSVIDLDETRTLSCVPIHVLDVAIGWIGAGEKGPAIEESRA